MHCVYYAVLLGVGKSLESSITSFIHPSHGTSYTSSHAISYMVPSLQTHTSATLIYNLIYQPLTHQFINQPLPYKFIYISPCPITPLSSVLYDLTFVQLMIWHVVQLMIWHFVYVNNLTFCISGILYSEWSDILVHVNHLTFCTVNDLKFGTFQSSDILYSQWSEIWYMSIIWHSVQSMIWYLVHVNHLTFCTVNDLRFGTCQSFDILYSQWSVLSSTKEDHQNKQLVTCYMLIICTYQSSDRKVPRLEAL